jgi:hypothetical protein
MLMKVYERLWTFVNVNERFLVSSLQMNLFKTIKEKEII